MAREVDDKEHEHEDDAAESGDGGSESAPAAKPARARRRATPPPTVRGGASTTSVVVFVVLVGGLAVGFALLGQLGSSSAGGGQRFDVGKTYDVSITLTSEDQRELGCAGPDAGELHCAFEGPGKASAKGANPGEDATLLQPYTTVDQASQLLGAGLWAQPALKEKLEKEKGAAQIPRFSVTCKYQVTAISNATSIRWHARDGWMDGNGWPIGKLTDCKVGK